MTQLRSGSATHVGRVRAVNQDIALESPTLFAVADGMGGHVGGEVAARVAVDALQRAFGSHPSLQGLQRAVSAANAAVWEESRTHEDLRGMGTTLTALALVADPTGQPMVGLANVGDSRAYLFSGGKLAQITADHSLAEEKVRQGELTVAEAAIHPHRHILTRAVGVGSNVDVDLWELHLRRGDRVLLCSDGLTNEVSPTEIAEVLAAVVDPTDAATMLVGEANGHGGNDNITVVVVDVVVGDVADGAEVGTGGAVAVSVAGLPDDDLPSDDGSDPGPDQAPVAAVAVAEPDADLTSVQPAVGRTPATAGPASDGADGDGADRDGAGDRTGMMVGGVTAGTGTGLLAAPAAGVGVGADRSKVAPTAKKETRRQRRRRQGVPRRITFRVLFFFVLVAGVVAGGYYFVRWYATDNWYVTVSGDRLAIYQGQPGGLLWFHPKLVDRTAVTTDQVESIRLPALRADVEEPSLKSAHRYISNLTQEYLDQQANPGGNLSGTVGPTGVLPTSTTTTVPKLTNAPTTGVVKPTGTPPTIPTTVAPTTAAPTTTTTVATPTTAHRED